MSVLGWVGAFVAADVTILAVAVGAVTWSSRPGRKR